METLAPLEMEQPGQREGGRNPEGPMDVVEENMEMVDVKVRGQGTGGDGGSRSTVATPEGNS